MNRNKVLFRLAARAVGEALNDLDRGHIGIARLRLKVIRGVLARSGKRQKETHSGQEVGRTGSRGSNQRQQGDQESKGIYQKETKGGQKCQP